MSRYFFHGMLAFLIAVVAMNTAVVGQDKVDRRDKKTDKAVTVSGKILEESMAGVKMKIGGVKEEIVPANEILRIYYDEAPPLLRQPLNSLFLIEDKEKDLGKLAKEYKDFQTRAAAVPNVKPEIKRYIEFKIAMLQASSAETDEAKLEARRGLEAFIKAHDVSWGYPFAARALARMQIDKGEYDLALKLLDSLSRSKEVPPEVRQEAELMHIDALFQANKPEEMRAKITKALADAATPEAQKTRFKVYQIGLDAQAPNSNLVDIVKKLDDVIAKNADPAIKALAFNIMGDCYMQKEQPRDAMWSYMFVDVVYPQDKAEHLKAMTKLLSYFESEKDNVKIQLYKDKIARLKQ